jgi:hypothetical protein
MQPAGYRESDFHVSVSVYVAALVVACGRARSCIIMPYSNLLLHRYLATLTGH